MTIPSDFNQNVQDWTNCQTEISCIDSQYQNELDLLIAQIKEHAAWVKGGKVGPEQGLDPAQALWMFQTQVAPLISENSEYQIKQEADALNIANDLRNTITSAQDDLNQIINDLNNKQQPIDQQISDMINSLQSLSSMINDKGAQGIFGPDTTSSMNGFISTITNVVGNPQSMQTFINNYQQAMSAGEPVPPEVNSLTTAFNNLNQSVSGMSSTIQTQMQYYQQNLQQFFAIYKSVFDDYSTLNSYIISKTTSN